MKVELTSAELMQGALVGVMRHVESLKSRRTPGYGASKDLWSLHLEGALGEMAFAKAMSIYWGGTVCSFSGADLGDNLQVRTRSKHDWDLLVRPQDADDHIYILVTGTAPNYVVRGWIVGSEAKRPHYLQSYGNRPDAYFVPQEDLRSPELLNPTHKHQISE